MQLIHKMTQGEQKIMTYIKVEKQFLQKNTFKKISISILTLTYHKFLVLCQTFPKFSNPRPNRHKELEADAYHRRDSRDRLLQCTFQF